MHLQTTIIFLYVAQMMIYVFDRVENIVGIRENAGYQQFLLFPQCFLNLSFSGSFKVVIVWQRVNPFPNKPWFLHVYSIGLL